MLLCVINVILLTKKNLDSPLGAYSYFPTPVFFFLSVSVSYPLKRWLAFSSLQQKRAIEVQKLNKIILVSLKTAKELNLYFFTFDKKQTQWLL